jgi:hypothetical protein
MMLHYHFDKHRVARIRRVDKMPRLIDARTFALDSVRPVISLKMQNLPDGRKTVTHARQMF